MKALVKCKFYSIMLLAAALFFLVGITTSDDQTGYLQKEVNK